MCLVDSAASLQTWAGRGGAGRGGAGRGGAGRGRGGAGRGGAGRGGIRLVLVGYNRYQIPLD